MALNRLSPMADIVEGVRNPVRAYPFHTSGMLRGERDSQAVCEQVNQVLADGARHQRRNSVPDLASEVGTAKLVVVRKAHKSGRFSVRERPIFVRMQERAGRHISIVASDCVRRPGRTEAVVKGGAIATELTILDGPHLLKSIRQCLYRYGSQTLAWANVLRQASGLAGQCAGYVHGNALARA